MHRGTLAATSHDPTRRPTCLSTALHGPHVPPRRAADQRAPDRATEDGGKVAPGPPADHRAAAECRGGYPIAELTARKHEPAAQARMLLCPMPESHMGQLGQTFHWAIDRAS